MNEFHQPPNRKKLWMMFFAVILFNIGIVALNSYLDSKETKTDEQKRQEAVESIKDSLLDVINK